MLMPAGALAQTFDPGPVLFGGHNYDPFVSFSVGGGNLTIVLREDGDAAGLNPHVLTGVLWMDSNTGAYGTVSANATAGSTVQNDDGTLYAVGETVAQHWAYRTQTFDGFQQGVGTAGFTDVPGGLFGNGDVFAAGGSPPLVNGVDWGMVSGFAAGGINGNENPFIVNSGTFVLSLGTMPAPVITGVRFLYGSAAGEGPNPPIRIPPLQVVPEGSSVGLMAAGMLPFAGLTAMFRRRRIKAIV